MGALQMSRAMAESRMRAPAPDAAHRGGARRQSQWQVAGAATVKTAAKAANSVGRWFGVTGDEQAMHAMHEEYKRQKTLERKKKGPVLSEKQVRQAQAALQESSSDDEDEEILKVKHMTRDIKEALGHYQVMWQSQKKELKKPRWFGGETSPTRRVSATMAPKRKHAHKRDETMVAMQLQALPTFTPWFIYLITLIQLLVFVGMMAYAYTKKEIAPFQLTPSSSICQNGSCPVGFNGIDETTGVERVIGANYLYGPTTAFLISVGAKFTLCMRSDQASSVELAQQRSNECGLPPTTCVNATEGYSCCSLTTGQSAGRKGMTTKETCDDNGGTWATPYTACSQTNDFIVLRPCCAIHLDVGCMLTTKDYCSFVNGKWQEDQQLCSQTLCLAPICKLLRGGYGITADATYANEPSSPNQWFRFFTALFVHAGVIHAILLLSCQYYFGTQIERQAGLLRTFFIYMFSGVGGFVISGIFAPESASMGCDPAVYGLIAVHVIELVQNWQIVVSPWLELLKLLTISIVSLGIGTLPFIDNWSHLGGFVFGLVSGIIFLPYINFGQWDLTRKRIMLAIALPLLIVMTVIAIVYFYKIQSTTFCTWCKYWDCIPYTSQIQCDYKI